MIYGKMKFVKIDLSPKCGEATEPATAQRGPLCRLAIAQLMKGKKESLHVGSEDRTADVRAD